MVDRRDKKPLPDFEKGLKNLWAMFGEADDIDRQEGKLAYQKYNEVMRDFVSHYGYDVPKITAAFCALSPNSDYVGNLRSLVTVLDGLEEGKPHEEITVATYNHCRDRAINYLLGEEFDTPNRGLKTLSFYYNIIDPDNPRYCTIDGHMAAAYYGDPTMRMKDVQLGRKEYRTIAYAMKVLANDAGLLPNQAQATIWFARKRTLEIMYDPHLDLFSQDDPWKMKYALYDLPAFG